MTLKYHIVRCSNLITTVNSRTVDNDFVARAFTLEQWRSIARRPGNGRGMHFNSSFGDGGYRLPVCRYSDHDVAIAPSLREGNAFDSEESTPQLRARLWCANLRHLSCGGVRHRYCHIRTPTNCSGAYTNLWPVRTQVRCPNASLTGNRWTFRAQCELGTDAAILLREELQKLDAERLEAVAAAEAYADRVSEAERKNAEMASKSGINPIIVARENKVPPKRRTLMDVDVIGTKWAIDSQAGRFVA
jgi:hypothetical protein